MDDKEFYQLLETIDNEKRTNQNQNIKETKECPHCHNDIEDNMIFCPFCGGKVLNVTQERISHSILVRAIELGNYTLVWNQICENSLDAQKILNDYVIDIMCNARERKVVDTVFEMLEPYRADNLFVQGLWERAIIEVNRDKGILDVCEIYRDSHLMNEAAKKELEIAQCGDTLSLFAAGTYLLYGLCGIKKDEEKAYRYLFQAAKQGYYPAKTLLSLNILEEKCSSDYCVGDIRDNLLVGAFFGNKEAKKVLLNEYFIDPSEKWESTSTLDIWGDDNAKYIRKYQEYRENFLEMIPRYDPIIETINSNNEKLVLEFLEQKEKQPLEEKRELEEEKQLEETLKLIVKNDLKNEYYFDVPETYIGDLYYNGEFVKRDYMKAKEYYQYAYEKGSAGAAYMIGTMYRDGVGVEKDLNRMVEWYKKSAEMGCEYAQYELGRSYLNGASISQKEVLKWLEKLAEKGYVEALTVIGKVVGGWKQNEGLTLEANYKIAINILKEALQQGEPSAQLTLAQCYYFGQGVEKNYNKAKELCEDSAEQGFLDARKQLKELFGIDYISRSTQAKIESLFEKVTECNQKAFNITDALRQKLGIPSYEHIYIAHDDTLRRNGDLSFAITENGIYYRRISGQKEVGRIFLKQIGDEQFTRYKICQNFLPMKLCSKKEINMLYKALGELEQVLKEEKEIKQFNLGEVELRRERERKRRNLKRIKDTPEEVKSEEENVEHKILKEDKFKIRNESENGAEEKSKKVNEDIENIIVDKKYDIQGNVKQQQLEDEKSGELKRKKGFKNSAIFSLICAIFSWFSAFNSMSGFSITLAIVGIILGVKGRKSNKKKTAMLGVIISGLLLFTIVIGVVDTGMTSKNNVNTSLENDKQTEFIKTDTNNDFKSGGSTEKKIEPLDSDSGYILPESDSRYLTERDLQGLDQATLRLARNEIYARHGRAYETEDLNEYFSQQSWYHGYLSASEFDNSVLNDYERANVELIRSIENSMSEKESGSYKQPIIEERSNEDIVENPWLVTVKDIINTQWAMTPNEEYSFLVLGEEGDTEFDTVEVYIIETDNPENVLYHGWSRTITGTEMVDLYITVGFGRSDEFALIWQNYELIDYPRLEALENTTIEFEGDYHYYGMLN